jgi:hypothetical protein
MCYKKEAFSCSNCPGSFGKQPSSAPDPNKNMNLEATVECQLQESCLFSVSVALLALVSCCGCRYHRAFAATSSDTQRLNNNNSHTSSSTVMMMKWLKSRYTTCSSTTHATSSLSQTTLRSSLSFITLN